MPRPVLVVVLTLGLLVAACGSGPNRGDLNLFSVDEELQLGRQLRAEVVQQAVVVDDPLVDGLVDEIGMDMVDQTALADREWTFTVIEDPTVNAFAVPGGHVFVRIAEDLATDGAVAKFSRGAEREADALGVAHFAGAGYPPEGIAGFFEVLLEQRERQPTALDQFFASHPLTEERLERVRDLAASLAPVPPLEVVDGSRLAEVQRRM